MPLPMSPREMMPIVARGGDLVSAIARTENTYIYIYILRQSNIYLDLSVLPG